jgi:hypothetical protein
MQACPDFVWTGRATFSILKTRNPVLKVLLISGYPAHGFPAQSLHEGCEGFLGKPDPSAIQPIDIVPGFQAGLPGKGWFVVRQAHDDCSP